MKIFGQVYASHASAVTALKKKKGWSDSRANAYVAESERRQHGKGK